MCIPQIAAIRNNLVSTDNSDFTDNSRFTDVLGFTENSGCADDCADWVLPTIQVLPTIL